MGTRASSLQAVNTLAINREIDSKYDAVLAVRDKLTEIELVAGLDIEALLVELQNAQDFTGISVVAGETAGWDAQTKTITVPTVKGDQGIQGVKGDTGERGLQGEKGDRGLTGAAGTNGRDGIDGRNGVDGIDGLDGIDGSDLTIEQISYDSNTGKFLWQFSDGTSYVTPDLRGPKGDTGSKGDKGDQGIGVHHIKGTSTTDSEGDFASYGEIDTYTLYGDAAETINLGYFRVNNGAAKDGQHGIMYRSTYDTNNNGIVDNSEKLDGRTIAEIQADITDTIGQANGIASLDSSGVLVRSQVPDMNVSLTGDITGSFTIDGSLNTSVSVSVQDNSHLHTFSNLTSTPTTLSGYGIQDAYTKAEVTTEINTAIGALVDGAPGALDTLNELAAALGDDANFAVTVTNSLASKVDENAAIAGGTNTKITYDSKGLVTGGSTPTTLSGYSIVDAYTKTEVQTVLPKIGLDITNVTAPNTGQLAWNQDEGTADLGLPGGSVLQIGQENVRTVRNSTASTITNGTVCMFDGTIGNSGRIKVKPFTGGFNEAMYVYGVATQDIAAGADGLITIEGKVRGIDTTGVSVGETWLDEDILYAKPGDAGRLTKVVPSVTELRMPIASVIRAHTSGTLEIRFTPINENQFEPRNANIQTHISSTNNPHGVTKAQVGLGNADNTSDINKPISIAMQDALDLKAPINNPTFTGVVSGITKTMVGLGNVDNTADSVKNVLSATKWTTSRLLTLGGDATGSVNIDGNSDVTLTVNVVDDSHNHAFGNLTGKPTTLSGYGITDADTSDQVTTKINNAVAALVDASPTTLDTLNELAAALGDDPNFATTVTTAIGTKADTSYVNTQLALKTDKSDTDSVNLTRADKYLAAQNIANMIYTNGDLTKIRYNNDTDVNYEVLNYSGGNLSTINHYTGGVLRGTTTLSYTNGNLVSAVFA